MKISYKLFGILFLGMIMLLGCGGDDPPAPGVNDDPDPQLSPQEIRKEELMSGPWSPSKVVRDGVEVTDEYDSFSLSIGEFTYTSTDGAPVWPASGTWAFSGDKIDEIVRDDGIVIKVTVTTTTLKLNFSRTESVFGGRLQSVDVNYEFELKN